MNEEAKVIAAQDNGEKMQWGRNWFYFRDGVKWTIRKKAVALLAGIAFVAICLIQTVVTDLRSQPVDVKPPIALEVTASSEALDEKQQEQSHLPAKKAPPKRSATVNFSGPVIIARPRNVKIPPGTMINARLVSGASNGLVRAILTDALTLNGEILLEEATVLVGQGSSTEERLMVNFTQSVFRDGTIAPIQAQACDADDKIVGLTGSKLGSKAVNISGSIGLGFLGGFSEGLQDTYGQGGVAVRQASIKNALLNATSTTALEQSKNLMSDLKEQRPIIEVPAGKLICVIFDVIRS